MSTRLLRASLASVKSGCLLTALCLTVVVVNINLYFQVTGRGGFKRITIFSRDSPTTNKTLPQTSTTDQPTTKPEIISAFEKFGYSSMKLMRQMESPRPLFNFSLVPWKIDANKSRYISRSLYDQHVNWSMVVVVKSQSDHVERRNLVRETWGSFKFLDGVRLEIIFVVGLGDDTEAELKLLKENGQYGDILQMNMKEVYADVGYKTLAGMQWVSQVFPSHWMYTSADDDMLPNLKYLYMHIEALMSSSREFQEKSNANKSMGIFHQQVISNTPIHCGFSFTIDRGPLRKGKWRVDNETYPLNKYPPFCHGGWYTMPVSLASKLYAISRTHAYYRMDDVWVTGLLRLSYFSREEVTSYFGRNRLDERIGILPERPHDVRHCTNEQNVLKSWNDVEPVILAQAREYIRSTHS